MEEEDDELNSGCKNLLYKTNWQTESTSEFHFELEKN